MSESSENRPVAVLSTNRLEAFSDGVFAVAITLLVLNLQPTNLWPQHPDLVHLVKPERMVGTHRHRQWFAARRGDRVVDETLGSDIQMCDRVLCQNRHPDVTCWGHDQPVESACPVPCG